MILSGTLKLVTWQI